MRLRLKLVVRESLRCGPRREARREKGESARENRNLSRPLGSAANPLLTLLTVVPTHDACGGVHVLAFVKTSSRASGETAEGEAGENSRRPHFETKLIRKNDCTSQKVELPSVYYDNLPTRSRLTFAILYLHFQFRERDATILRAINYITMIFYFFFLCVKSGRTDVPNMTLDTD